MKVLSKNIEMHPTASPESYDEPKEIEGESEESEPEYHQWNVQGRKNTPMPKLNLKKHLAPGYYMPHATPQGIYLEKMSVRLDGLVDFGNGVASEVVDQIGRFWDAEQKFREINKSIKVLYKRGMLLYGPPGCGKSSMISIVMRDIIKQGGIALSYAGTNLTTAFIRIIREIQPNMKILVVIEDLDGIIRQTGEEDILNMLDGVDTVLDSVIFLATTNYFQNLSGRMLRPSRFDLKIEMGYPAPVLRKRYLKDLLKSHPGKTNFNLEKAVKDTNGFSFADLKELFISACVFEYKYEDCVQSLRQALYSEEIKNDSKMRANDIAKAAQVFARLTRR